MKMFSSEKKLHRVLSAAEIRKTFIDYFTLKRDHLYVRSSPVVPFCDSSLAFVNAGMNQFKSVFLGTSPAPARRVANSQKCIRVGGKHNDLSIVGQDGYHHTFFEMLGNWSFGDYFKRDACSMAFELLRENYGIDRRRMYVTYFKGDRKLKLPADDETYEIWRSLGFPKERIVGFGTEHNFWEMGAVGPCGPCTEIHLDHLPEPRNPLEAAKLVNQGYSNLTELWNLVFIQFKRNDDGSITPLPSQHVDTGMGFERLTAVMQGKSSNYDTDLFMPIFKGIQKHCKVPAYSGLFNEHNSDDLDTNYRIMADHMRMISVCLADGMLPDMNQKLRRVMRKVYNISERIFKDEKLPYALVPIICDSLGGVYPEIYVNSDAINDIMAHEQEIYKTLRADSIAAFSAAIKDFPQLDSVDLIDCPGFVPAYREFQSHKQQFRAQYNNYIPGTFLYKMHGTYGLTEDHFHIMALLDHMKLDLDGYQEEIERAKRNARIAASKEIKVPKHDELLAEWTHQLPDTELSYVYFQSYSNKLKEYQVPTLHSQIVSIVYDTQVCLKDYNMEVKLPVVPFNGDAMESTTPAEKIHPVIYVVTESSNFFVQAGGQQSDIGEIHIMPQTKQLSKDWVVVLEVMDLRYLNNTVVHICRMPAKLKYVGIPPKKIPSKDINQDKQTIDIEKEAKRAAKIAKIERACKTVIVRLGDDTRLVVDQEHRKQNACHHTAVHMLNGAIRNLYNKVTFQVGSSVTMDRAKLEVGLIGKRLNKDDVELIENLLKDVVDSSTPVTLKNINSLEVMQSDDITIIPGETYPDTDLRMITIQVPYLDFVSKELCCGTHVGNTSVLGDICITNLKQTNRARFAFTVVARKRAKLAYDNTEIVNKTIKDLEMHIKGGKYKTEAERELQLLRHRLLNGEMLLPYLYKLEAVDHIEVVLRKSKDKFRITLNEFVDAEMRSVLQEQTPDKTKFILHYLDSSALMEEVPLQKATRLCKDRPILVIGNCDGTIRARCCVPKKYQTDNFDAGKWLNRFASVFGCQITSPKGQVLKNVSLMKGRKLNPHYVDQLDSAILSAHEFAAEQLKD